MTDNPTIGRLRELFIYEEDTGIIRWVAASDRWGRKPPLSVAGYLHAKTGYLRLRVDGKTHPAHRVAYAMIKGMWPLLEIDHINGNRSDNRAINLREVSTQQNQFNRKGCNKNKTQGGLLGVYWCKKRWVAAIRINGVLNRLGSFSTKEEAHELYIAAKSKEFSGVVP